MKQLKLQAYDPEYDKTYTVRGIEWNLETGEIESIDILSGIHNAKLFTLKEWTTKTDNNGVDIYDGDVVKYKGDLADIVWQDCRWLMVKREIIKGLSNPIPLAHASGRDLVIVNKNNTILPPL